jgi:hypothetical protein
MPCHCCLQPQHHLLGASLCAALPHPPIIMTLGFGRSFAVALDLLTRNLVSHMSDDLSGWLS